MSQFLVLPDDDGIRPNGPSDQCFYCGQKVGQPHGAECVMLRRFVTYAVHADPWGVVAIYKCPDPSFWDVDMCSFHKNESSWCCGNMLTEGTDLEVTQSKIWSRLTEDDDCLCSKLRLVPIFFGEDVFSSES